MKTLIIICFALSFVTLFSAEKEANIFYKNKSVTIELNGEKCAINFALYKDPVTRKYLTFGLDDNLMSGEITVVPETPNHNINLTIDRFDVKLLYFSGVSRCALEPSFVYFKKLIQTEKQKEDNQSFVYAYGGIIGALIAGATSSSGDTSEPFVKFDDIQKVDFNSLKLLPKAAHAGMMLFFDVAQIRKEKESAVEISYFDSLACEKRTIRIDL